MSDPQLEEIQIVIDEILTRVSILEQKLEKFTSVPAEETVISDEMKEASDKAAKILPTLVSQLEKIVNTLNEHEEKIKQLNAELNTIKRDASESPELLEKVEKIILRNSESLRSEFLALSTKQRQDFKSLENEMKNEFVSKVVFTTTIEKLQQQLSLLEKKQDKLDEKLHSSFIEVTDSIERKINEKLEDVFTLTSSALKDLAEIKSLLYKQFQMPPEKEE